MTESLVDPQLEALRLSDPAAYLQGEPSSPAVDQPVDIARVALEIAAAFLVIRRLVADRLAAEDPRPDEVTVAAGQAWQHHAPVWLRLMVPAVKQAYRLGQVQGLTPDEVEALAVEYVEGLGSYLSDTSGEALLAGYVQQLDGKWSGHLAWHRATVAYGLDRQQMRAYVASLMSGDGARPDLVPTAARLLVDKALATRAEAIGESESWRAMQSGQALAWMLLQRRGQLPPDTQREWRRTDLESCAICVALDGQRVPLTEPFVLEGARYWAPGAHPNCRCRQRLVLRLALQEVAKAAVGAAGICLVALDTGRVLMLQRALTPGDPAAGQWEFPGGGLEADELPLDGARREFAEEVRRRLPPDAQAAGSWTQGPYQGFVVTTASEANIEPHRRGRVVNPDDPDGDAIEALAWWDPHLLARNPSVRQEVRQALPDIRAQLPRRAVAKARGADSYDRDRRGRFAPVEQRPTRLAEPPAPEVQAVLDQLRGSDVARPDLFGKPDLFASKAGLFGPKTDLFGPPAGGLFRARRPALFDRGADPRRRPPSGRARRRVVHHILVPPRVEGEAAPRSHEPFYLPATEFLQAYEEHPEALWHPGDVLDFDDANAAARELAAYYYADFASPETQTLSAVRSLDPLELDVDQREQFNVSDQLVDEQWAELRPHLAAAHRQALANVDDVVDRLGAREIANILQLAGYDPVEDANSARARIVRAVNGGVGSDQGLAGAYADWVTWSEPEVLGDSGVVLGRMLEEASDNEIRLFEPVQAQYFTFENGFHDDTEFTPSGHLVALHSDYAVSRATYHSCLLELGTDSEPFMVGWRELSMVPVDSAGARLPRD